MHKNSPIKLTKEYIFITPEQINEVEKLYKTSTNNNISTIARELSLPKDVVQTIVNRMFQFKQEKQMEVKILEPECSLEWLRITNVKKPTKNDFEIVQMFNTPTESAPDFMTKLNRLRPFKEEI
jgi:hypothetical protein